MSGLYDERLAASAPAATRAEKQGGYDVDLLEEQPGGRGASATPPPVPVLAANHAKAETGGYAYAPYDEAQSRPVPWYRTRKWMLIFFLGAVVVVAAIIGGAVGGTVGHSSKGAAASDSAGGAAGPAVSQAQGGGEGQGVATRETSQGGSTSATTNPGGIGTISVPAPATTTAGDGGGGSS